MGRAPCCSKVGLRRGPWDTIEDTLLLNYIQAHGEGHWRSLPRKAGLLRCGKSCRLRWLNYLKPDIKRGNITPDEDDLIIRLHSLLGNRWSLIAGRLPGRTDNEIKNYWNTHLSKRFKNPETHKKLLEPLVTQQVMSKSNINKTTKSSLSEQNPKVHLPKPVRATKTSFSFPRNESFELDPLLDYSENMNSFLVDDHDFVNGSDFECLSHEDDTSSLEKLYEEYLQILKTKGDDDESL